MHLHFPDSYNLPFLHSTEHTMPLGKLVLWGDGLLFTHTIVNGLRAGGIWLVMQDKCGTSAVAEGDIVMLAHIENVDWLSDCQIRLELTVKQGGVIHQSNASHSPHPLSSLRGVLTPLWHDLPLLEDHDILVSRLHQWLTLNHSTTIDATCRETSLSARWICWRWLELLPLPLTIKQRLLKHPSPRICMRYFKQIIRQSDLF